MKVFVQKGAYIAFLAKKSQKNRKNTLNLSSLSMQWGFCVLNVDLYLLFV